MAVLRLNFAVNGSHVSEAHDRKIINRGLTMSNIGDRWEFLSSVSYYLVPRLGLVPLCLPFVNLLEDNGRMGFSGCTRGT